MLKPFQRIPVLIAIGVIVVVSGIRALNLKVCELLECMTYDFRVRQAANFPTTTATNLGFVAIDEESVTRVADGSLGFSFGLYWPRQVYGRIVQELYEQGAKAVALDIIFGELRPDHASVLMADGRLVESDEFFALQMRRASNTIVALTGDLKLPELFWTNAMQVGHIVTDKDSDGILRRARAFRTDRQWHFAFRQVEADTNYGVDLQHARIETNKIVLVCRNAEPIEVPLDKEGHFDLADFGGGKSRKAQPFEERRIWHMGVVLAAKELGLDLDRAEIDLPGGRITLRGQAGVQRVIPVNAEGDFYIDWCMAPNHPNLTIEAVQTLLAQNYRRVQGQTNQLNATWRGKLAVVGSSALVGNNLTDRGATPLHEDTVLVSKHWNVANSIITGRFVRRAGMGVEIGLIAFMGILAAVLTWRLRAMLAFWSVILLGVAYVFVGLVIFIKTRYWIPLVLPIVGSAVIMYGLQLAWRVVFEQAHSRRIRSIFSKVVSPKIVKELVDASDALPSIAAGTRRQITVLFADVRGFTELTDSSQERVTEFVRQNNLTGSAAEACFNEQARETLGTVNLYLGLVADVIIKLDGTLDKFIGDCVMAFWGAPTPNPRHAVACVEAAIEAQRAIEALNEQRRQENQRREVENRARASSGLPPKNLLPILLLGSGINTGMATVGLMGSQSQQQSYTAFGREVNLASRLEGASGRGRIFIGETTFCELQRDAPGLAARCTEMPPTELKGFRSAVKVYEVPWRVVEQPVVEVAGASAARSPTASSLPA